MGLFDFVGDIFGGGGGSSASVTSTVNLNVNGLDKINTTSTSTSTGTNTIDLKPIEIKPLSFTEVLDIKPIELKPLSISETLELKPVNVNETVELKPVTVNETFDLRPVAIDSCQTVRLAPLPETRICQPYRHHVSYTMFGVEWSAVTYEGESQQAIESPRRPQVVESSAPVRKRRRPGPAKVVGGGGIRVRVVDPDNG